MSAFTQIIDVLGPMTRSRDMSDIGWRMSTVAESFHLRPMTSMAGYFGNCHFKDECVKHRLAAPTSFANQCPHWSISGGQFGFVITWRLHMSDHHEPTESQCITNRLLSLWKDYEYQEGSKERLYIFKQIRCWKPLIENSRPSRLAKLLSFQHPMLTAATLTSCCGDERR